MKLPPGHQPGAAFSKPTAYGGFGQKMLEQMGWSKGQGLGKEKSGMKEAIEVKKKEDTLGVGASTPGWKWDWKYWEDAYNVGLQSMKQGGSSQSSSKNKRRKVAASSSSASSSDDDDDDNVEGKSSISRSTSAAELNGTAPRSALESSPQTKSDSDSDSSDEDEEHNARIAAALAVNRDGTAASASAEELKLARRLAKDPWGRFDGAEQQHEAKGEEITPKRKKKKKGGRESIQKQQQDGQQQQEVPAGSRPAPLVVVVDIKGPSTVEAKVYMEAHDAQRQGKRGLGKSSTLKIAGVVSGSKPVPNVDRQPLDSHAPAAAAPAMQDKAEAEGADQRQQHNFSLRHVMGNINARSSNSDEEGGEPPGGDGAEPQQLAAAGAVKQHPPGNRGISKRYPPQAAADKLWGGRLIVSSEDNVFDLADVKSSSICHDSEVPSLFSSHVGDLEGFMSSLTVIDKHKGEGLAQPYFARSYILVKEKAVGQNKTLPALIDDLVRKQKYIRIREQGHPLVVLSVVLKEPDGTLADFKSMAVKLEDDKVHRDRLAVLHYLKPGERPPSAPVKFAGVANTSLALETAASWDPHKAVAKSSLKKSEQFILEQEMDAHHQTRAGGEAPLATPLAALAVAASTAGTATARPPGDDDDDEGYDGWLDEPFVEPVLQGGFGAGMVSNQGAPRSVGFMAEDFVEAEEAASFLASRGLVEGVMPAAPCSDGLQRQPSGAAIHQPSVDLHLLNTSAATTGNMPQGLGGPSSGGGAGPSPTTSTPEQDLQRHDNIVRQDSLPRVTSLPVPAIVQVQAKLREALGQDECALQRVMPTIEGFIKRFETRGLRGLRVHVDKSYIVKHEELATAGGLEGRDVDFPFGAHLLEGILVLTEKTLEDIRNNKLDVIQGSNSPGQLYSAGCILLWDELLPLYSNVQQLEALLKAMHTVQVLYKKQQGKGNSVRLVIVVVPDAVNHMPASDHSRLQGVMRFAATQKFIVIATLSQVLSFLRLLATA
eukprot:gene3576-3842_t